MGLRAKPFCEGEKVFNYLFDTFFVALGDPSEITADAVQSKVSVSKQKYYNNFVL